MSSPSLDAALTALFLNVRDGLVDFLRGSLAAGEIERTAIDRACQAEIDAPEHAPTVLRLTDESQAFLKRLADTSDRDLLQVAAKMLKSARLAAITHKNPEPAVYEDQPLFPKSE